MDGHEHHQGHMKTSTASAPKNHGGSHGGGHDHGAMIADFRRRFWVSIVLTLPVLALSPMLQRLVGLERTLAFPGDRFVLLGLSSALFFYGGWPFLSGLVDELRKRRPGMMTLIARGHHASPTSTAPPWSSGCAGEIFFWELATLIDIMLLGHWIEMRSVMGASARARGAGSADARRGAPDAVPDGIDGGRARDRSAPSATGCWSSRARRSRSTARSSKGGRPSTSRCSRARAAPVDEGRGRRGDRRLDQRRGCRSSVEVRKTGEETYLSQVIELVREAQETQVPHAGPRQPRRSSGSPSSRSAWAAITLAVWLVLGQRLRLRAGAHGHRHGHRLPARAGPGDPARRGGLDRRSSATQRPPDPRPDGLREARARCRRSSSTRPARSPRAASA